MNRLGSLSALVLCAVLATCGPGISPTPFPTPVAPTAAPRPTPTPSTLVICMAQEPDSLYLYGSTMPAATHVRAAIYDGPIETLSYGYQPVILEKLPALADGDAVIQVVAVGPGDRVADNAGNPVELTEHSSPTIWVRPAGCRSSECAIEYVSGTVQMEQLVVTFTLKPGLAWADGTAVTAHDSQFSYNLSMDPDTPSIGDFGPAEAATYRAVDDYTVVWTGVPGYLDNSYQIKFWQPLPQHQLGHLSAAELVTADEAARTPLGYGPFTVQEWIVGDHITLERNPHYFRASEGLPRMDRVTYRFLEDPYQALAALLAGECDIITQDLSLDLVARQMISMESKGLAKPFFAAGTSFEHLDFGIQVVDSYERPDFFGDQRVRRAVGLCLNRQAVIDSLLFGRSIAPTSYLPPEHPLHNHDLEPLPYDPVLGKALLAEVGWIDADGDGIREAHSISGIADGTRLSFQWTSTEAPLRASYLRMFAADLKACGIAVTASAVSSGQLFADGPDGALFGRHFDLASYGWLTGVEPPCELYLCDQIPSEENGWAGLNDMGYCSADFDAACKAALQTLPGTPEYAQYHQEAQAIFVQDLPSLPLFLRLRIAATRPEITGFILDPTANSEMWNVEEFARQP